MCYLLTEPNVLLIAIVVGFLRNTMVCLQKIRNIEKEMLLHVPNNPH